MLAERRHERKGRKSVHRRRGMDLHPSDVHARSDERNNTTAITATLHCTEEQASNDGIARDAHTHLLTHSRRRVSCVAAALQCSVASEMKGK
jgi:hypothetical protein